MTQGYEPGGIASRTALVYAIMGGLHYAKRPRYNARDRFPCDETSASR